jgi:hypothetical protein
MFEVVHVCACASYCILLKLALHGDSSGRIYALFVFILHLSDDDDDDYNDNDNNNKNRR